MSLTPCKAEIKSSRLWGVAVGVPCMNLGVGPPEWRSRPTRWDFKKGSLARRGVFYIVAVLSVFQTLGIVRSKATGVVGGMAQSVTQDDACESKG